MSADGLVGVEARHLAALQAVAEESSFSRAALRLGYAQSAVSQQIAALERAVGLKLIERPGGPKPVSVTEAGEIVLRHADRLLARLGALRADLDQLVAGESGTLRVGTFQSAGARILPGVVREFRARWPEVRVEIREELDESILLEAVAAGALDLTFASASQPVPPQLDSGILLEDRYVLLAPPGSPYRGRTNVELQELDGLDVIEPPKNVSCEQILQRAWAAAGVSRRTVFRTDDNLTVMRMVGAGIGHALVPELAAEPGLDADVEIVPVAGGALVRRIAIYWHRDRYRSRAADTFVEIAREVGAEILQHQVA
ncbi:MAG TPA: LysR family transcriptional regulator [Gaiellales bacterium]|jgi:DNA-binding transcriptional LysR family regulator